MGVLTAGQTRNAIGAARHRAALGDPGEWDIVQHFSGVPAWVNDAGNASAAILGFTVAEGERFAYSIDITCAPDGLTADANDTIAAGEVGCHVGLDDTGDADFPLTADSPYLAASDGDTFVAGADDTIFSVILRAKTADVIPDDEVTPADFIPTFEATLRARRTSS